MTPRKLIVTVSALALVALLSALVASSVFAQAPTPGAKAPGGLMPGGGRGLPGIGMWGGRGMGDFDAIAKALNLTPTQLFEQMHSGKTLEQIATAQGVDLEAALAKIRDEANAARIKTMQEQIAKAVADGKMTQDQADWLLLGLDKGYLGKGGFFGFGGPSMHDRGTRGFPGPMPGGRQPSRTPGKTG